MQRMFAHRKASMVSAAAAAICAVAPVTSVAASTTLTPPYASTYTDPFPPCTLGDSLSFPSGEMPVGTCIVAQSSSASTGHIAASAYLQSPVNGTVPTVASATPDNGVNAIYHLAAPTSQLSMTVNIHINSATASVDNSLLGLPSGITDLGSLLLGNSIIVGIGASAFETQCSPNCAGGNSLITVSEFQTGTTTVSNQDVSFPVTLANACPQSLVQQLTQPPTLCPLPAGDVTIRPEVYLFADQLGGRGTASGQIDAVVTSIVIN